MEGERGTEMVRRGQRAGEKKREREGSAQQSVED
jgi:hypothetical protein